ncbi:MAG: hypothetical protein K9L98_02200 [Candidatus Pacebacteria bacterium]|nr:hypothetical protein [Candidatus Paceibacterota bacterium]MCF7862798.1 hypothetical protein [Candidatus Paceibacterota bacterium]
MQNKFNSKILLVIVIILLVIGLVYVFFNNSKQNQNELINQNQTALPADCIDQQEGVPVITSISSYSGSVGDKIEIKGCNFSGFEGDKNVWMESDNGIRGIIYGEKESTDKSVIFVLKSTLCQTDNSYSGNECEKSLNIIPGVYKIYTTPWGKKSNEVTFTVENKGNLNSELERKPSRYFCVGEFCDGSGSGNQDSLTVLKIPLVTSGGNVGCGSKIFFAPHTVAKTTAVLDATYKMLFDIKTESEIQTVEARNPIGSYTKLFYQSVSIKDGTAKVMLTGNMYGPGECSFPEIREQINQSAFQFDTVSKIEVYLNGEIFDWCSVSDADISESKCDKIPRYWIDKK